MEAVKKWYHKTEWIFLLVFLFWPAGLFLLWTSKDIPKKNKLIVTGIFLVLLIIGLCMHGPEIFRDIRRFRRRLF
jgi:hypothetical protein